MKKLNIVLLAAIVILYALSGCATQKPIQATGSEFLEIDGITGTPAVWEDGLRTDTKKGSFEWWYFDASFNDGSTAVIVFFTKHLLEMDKPLSPMVSISITKPDGNKITVSASSPENEFFASKKKCDVKIGSSWVKGDLKDYDLHFEVGNVAADLHFSGLVPAWRPGAGKTYYSKDLSKYFAWLPAIPYGTVEGTLMYDGITHKLNGTGYHDHNWGNVKLHKVMTQWYWGRAQIGQYTVIFSQMLTASGYGSEKIPIFLLAEGNEILFDGGGEMDLETSGWQRHEGGRDYPTEIVLNIKKGSDSARITISNPVLLEAASLIGNAGSFKKAVIKFFANPYYLRFKARFSVEIKSEGLKKQADGTGLFEMMLLRGKQTIR